MSDTMVRAGTLSVLAPGTLLAVAVPVGVGPTWFLAVAQVLVTIGLIGTLMLRRRPPIRSTAGTAT